MIAISEGLEVLKNSKVRFNTPASFCAVPSSEEIASGFILCVFFFLAS